MARFYQHSCGHTSFYSLSGSGDVPCTDLCEACRQARCGETIQFARYGAVPTSGRSTNHRDKSQEAGVSVYEIRNGQIQYTGWWFDIANRPLYLGEGIIRGWGSDGEPVVQILAVRKASKKQAAALQS
jgi:hypothetical protein